MRELTMNELDHVDGGINPLVAGLVGAAFAFGYQVGKDMAERDNARNSAE